VPSIWGRFRRALTGERAAGKPRSSNGASSFHLIWDVRDPDPLVDVSAVLEIVTPPAVRDLYFWALQVDFVDENRTSLGGGHTGLQWNPRYRNSTAVNWGGYASQRAGGYVLAGSRSLLGGFPDDPNTLSYRWGPGRPYRLRVYRASEQSADRHAWRAEVIDLDASETTNIRELYGAGAFLASPIVWSEVFADCDAPGVTARWSGFEARTASGRLVRPSAVTVNYQNYAAGGCSNTDVVRDGDGFLQITNTARRMSQGSRLVLDVSKR
jgi:hypothetical protein